MQKSRMQATQQMIKLFNETEASYFESLHIRLYTENGREQIWLKAKRINLHRNLEKDGKNKESSKGNNSRKSIYVLFAEVLFTFQSTPISFCTILYICKIYFYNMVIVSDKD